MTMIMNGGVKKNMCFWRVISDCHKESEIGKMSLKVDNWVEEGEHLIK